jgi:hypothetical protein
MRKGDNNNNYYKKRIRKWLSISLTTSASIKERD